DARPALAAQSPRLIGQRLAVPAAEAERAALLPERDDGTGDDVRAAFADRHELPAVPSRGGHARLLRIDADAHHRLLRFVEQELRSEGERWRLRINRRPLLAAPLPDVAALAALVHLHAAEEQHALPCRIPRARAVGAAARPVVGDLRPALAVPLPRVVEELLLRERPRGAATKHGLVAFDVEREAPLGPRRPSVGGGPLP